MKNSLHKEQKNEKKSININRRKFIGNVSAATAGLTIVPAHVLGGPGRVAPSDKINVAYIGLGTQGLRQLPALLNIPAVQVTAVCDPQRKAINYYDWGPTSLRNQMRELISDPGWETGGNNTIPGGLDNGKELTERFYALKNKDKKYRGVNAYTDFRELFEKESGLDAVQVMTTDHVHGLIAAAALKRDIAVTMHKPLSNRLVEGKKVVDMANRSDAVTHFMPWDSNGNMDQIMAWINSGAIGNLEEIHNWSYRPVWPQYAQIPADRPKIPEGFDWDLWLGPEEERPYHPHYTNMVFRGWYDFGGGSMADMGHYSLWCVFEALKLANPTIVEPNSSHVCDLNPDGSAYKINNDFAFPYASTVRFKYPAIEGRQAVDLVWYDGGMRPPTPQEFYDKGIEFPSEGMMFKGDKGIIMTSAFTVKDPYLLSGDVKETEEVSAAAGAVKIPGVERFINGVKAGEQIAGNFRQAWPITEAVNLYAAALRAHKTLHYDAKNMKITNDEKANEYLDRNYRRGWNIKEI
ncbi:MAG: Gfo/Idh/MocA family oxidoreductase [Bacteroidales bacterium]|nr:Gfo/Idh/MocA family oxidoreductase [Bacteroidales bacterium]